VAINPISISGPPMLVRISAKKKSLNLTVPNGAINIFQITIASSFLAVLWNHLKGLQQMMKKIERRSMDQ